MLSLRKWCHEGGEAVTAAVGEVLREFAEEFTVFFGGEVGA